MNTYKKFAPHTFVAKCPQQQHRGDTITLTTKRGKEHQCTVHNLVGKDQEGNWYYSITRNDGFDYQEWCKARAARREQWAEAREAKSQQYYEASKEGSDFLSLGEPIKVGHHSEKRHRALIERNWNRMGKSVENSDKAQEHRSVAEYWAARADEINLSMPDSLDYYAYELEEAIKHHKGLKDGSIPRGHSMSLQYAKKRVNELTKKLETAKRLWG